jgi:hypothetical protein
VAGAAALTSVPDGYDGRQVALGTSIFLIAVGAILRYAVTITVSGVEIQTVGLILMIVGIMGLVISIGMLVLSRDRGVDDYPPTRRY